MRLPTRELETHGMRAKEPFAPTLQQSPPTRLYVRTYYQPTPTKVCKKTSYSQPCQFANDIDVIGASTTTMAIEASSSSSNDRQKPKTSSSSSSGGLASCCNSFFEYETPKVVTIQNVPVGLLRVVLQLAVVAFVVVYQLWYARGYQEFAEVESSVMTKVKGLSRSVLTPAAKRRIPPEWHYMYERIWDEADYVIPPAENGAFFVMTNVVLTPNQTRTTCPEVNGEHCDASTTCAVDLLQTGLCVPSGVVANVSACEISSWCPVEVDRLPMDELEGPLIPGVENYTVFIKNSISFSRFGKEYQRKNMRETGDGVCVFRPDDPPGRLCPIFRLGDIVAMAGGSIRDLSVKGGVVGIGISWNCDLDWSFAHCLPEYSFRILDDDGWNFRYAFYHEETRRTLVKAYGLKFQMVIDGRAGKFDVKNTVIVLVTGTGLLGLSAMFCDFLLLNYSPERQKVKEKKYESVLPAARILKVINTGAKGGGGGKQQRRWSKAREAVRGDAEGQGMMG